MKRLLILSAAVVASYSPLVLRAADWPQFRHNAGRSAATETALAGELALSWTREIGAPRPAFPSEERLRFDASYEPVVLGKTMFVPSMVTDSVTALDTDTGKMRWRFFADGPIRFAPIAWQDKVYAASDDGFLYCLNAVNGELFWKFRAAPAEKAQRMLLGNGRLISLWPVRGGPVLADRVIYLASGLWPADGVYVYALDAASGKQVWANTTSSSIPGANMDHGINQHAGITPQGYLAIVGDQLVVPCGAQLPAFLNLKTGKLGEYNMGWGGRVGLPKGSWFVAGAGKHLTHSGDLYDITRPNDEVIRGDQPKFKRKLYPGGFTRFAIDPRNQRALGVFRKPVITREAMYFNDVASGIVAYDLADYELTERAKSNVELVRKLDKYPDRWTANLKRKWLFPSKHSVHLQAGLRLFVGGKDSVAAVAIPKQGEEPRIAWSAKIAGTPSRMLAADNKLFVVTLEGDIFAFAPDATESIAFKLPATEAAAEDVWTKQTADLLTKSSATEGYALMLGVEDVRQIEELARQSTLNVIAIESDAKKVVKLREQLADKGLYGTRATVALADPATHPLPPYFANLVIAKHSTLLEPAIQHALRPYGGAAILTTAIGVQDDAVRALTSASRPDLNITKSDNFVVVRREGSLPGADDWTHSGANAANAGASQDRFLKAPLGLLWFDGSLRWHRKPGSAVVRISGGRVIVLADRLHAIDAFTGRRMWERPSPISVTSLPEMVAVDGRVFLARDAKCIEMDAATGRTLREIERPRNVSGRWSNLRVAGSHILATFGKHVVSIDRKSGDKVWDIECDRSTLNVAVGGGKVFCSERIEKRRGETPGKAKTTIRAIDLKSGDLVWQQPGTGSVRYSAAHDLLITSASILKAADGTRVRPGVAESQLVGDRVLSGTRDKLAVFDLATGDKSGVGLEWFRRGCTGMRSSCNIVTTRYKANAAYLDLESREITPLWNIRPGCNNNLFPAGGVLNVPNVTGGCECNYTPTSKAFAPQSELVRKKG